MGTNAFKLFAVAALPLALSGCFVGDIFNFGASGESGPAGVFRSNNSGQDWEAANAVLSVGTPRSIEGVAIAELVQDPTDAKTLYATTPNNGMYYSHDRGQTWQGTLGGVGIVRSVAVDYEYRCTLYAAAGSRLFKTVDCGRAWAPVFTDTRADSFITKVELDSRYPRTVYVALKAGDLLRSTDGGGTWSTVYRFNDKITDFSVGKGNNRNLYVGTATTGLWRSNNLGLDWESFKEITMRILPDSNAIGSLYVMPNENYLFLQTAKGLLRTGDAGRTWLKYELITAPEQTAISSFTVNPRNPNEVYYVIGTTLYRTANDGANWKTVDLPSRRPVWKLLVDSEDGRIVYLGYGIGA